MAIKNGRYKDKNGAVRHFETNENMVIVDGGQKTLKQKLSSLLESLSDLLKKFTAHETSKTAHEDIRAELSKTGISDVSVSPATTGFNDLLSFAKDLQSKNCKMWHGTVSGFSDLPVQDWGFQCDLQMTGGNILATINKQQSGGQVFIRETNASGEWVSEWREIVDKTITNAINTTLTGITADALKVKSASDFGKDFNNANIIGMYHIIDTQSWTNKPPTNENVGNLIVMGGTNNNTLSKVQYFIPYNGTGYYIRTRGYGQDEWYDWKALSTTDIPNALNSRGYLTSIRATDTSKRANGIYTSWGDASGAPSGQGFGNYISTVGLDVNNIAELYLSAHNNGGVWYRGGAYADNPEWQRVLTSAIGFYDRNLNQTNVDSVRGNWVAGISVSDGTGTAPFGGWNNIMQFDCQHFITQIGAGVNATSSACKGLAYRSKWTGSETFSEWYEVATISKTSDLTLLNGWNVWTGEKTIYKSGNICTLNVEIKDGTYASNTVLFTIPSGYRPSVSSVQSVLFRNTGTGATSDSRHGLIVIEANGNVRLSTIGLPQSGDALTLNLTWGVA